MAIGDPYTTGTVTVAAGSTTVVGFGTAWSLVARRGDDIHAAGLTGIVGNVVDDTHLDLLLPWAGEELTDAAYALLPRSTQRYSAAVALQTNDRFLAALQRSKIVWSGDAPDVSLGEEGEIWLSTASTPWRWWRRESGAWIEQDPPAVGIALRGAYDAGAVYAIGDAVTLDGSLYGSRQDDNRGHDPTASTEWWTLLVGRGEQGEQGPPGPQGPAGLGDLLSTNNLSDVADVAAAAANLSVVRFSAQELAVAQVNQARANLLFPASGYPLGFRNKIINGNFIVNQTEATGTVTLAAYGYGHDRWKGGADGATYTSSGVGIDKLVTISAGTLRQVVEDVNVEAGTYVLSWEGTAAARMYQNGVAEGPFLASPIVKTDVVAASTLVVEFSVGTVTKVQLEVGSIPTPFERISYADQLYRCMRYRQFLDQGWTGTYAVGSGNFVTIAGSFAPMMRVAPTLLGWNWNNALLIPGIIGMKITSVVGAPTSPQGGRFDLYTEEAPLQGALCILEPRTILATAEI
ncbi:hypothetical protein [Rhodovulum sp. PH10]|uniref:hypothetical protein n=1 Tax=Rhodovulum sp. PH10 TaxID=1187851 RepID=UPI00058F7180|nr:hypothetical protein [Rhodovulum sp. PH10]